MFRAVTLLVGYLIGSFNAYATQCVDDSIAIVAIATTADHTTTVKTKSGREFKIDQKNIEDYELVELQNEGATEAPVLICTDDGKEFILVYLFLEATATKVDRNPL